MDWKTACRPLCKGGLGIRDIQRTNHALHTRWVYRMMQLPGDLVAHVLADSYGFSINWESRSRPTKGALAFWTGLRPAFLVVLACFCPSLGDGSYFAFGWMTRRGVGCCKLGSRAFSPWLGTSKPWSPNISLTLGGQSSVWETVSPPVPRTPRPLVFSTNCVGDRQMGMGWPMLLG